MERVEDESAWFFCPGFADELVWGEASECLEASGEVVGVDEVAQMGPQLIVGFVEVAFDGRVLDGSVHPFDLAVIRYEIGGASLSACPRKGTGDMVSPSGTRGAGSTKVRAGRR